jgi:hypothetical protein
MNGKLVSLFPHSLLCIATCSPVIVLQLNLVLGAYVAVVNVTWVVQ